MSIANNTRFNKLNILCSIFIALLICNKSYASNIDQHVKQLIDNLHVAVKTKNKQLLFDHTNQIYAIWRGQQAQTTQWKKLRGAKIKALLNSLALVEQYVDWQFDPNISAADTLDPPLDHNIMQYSQGFGTQLIEDPKLKAEIKVKLQTELERLKKAKAVRSFQRHVNNHYQEWLNAFLRSLINNFSDNDKNIDKNYVTNLIKETLKPTRFKNCIIKITNNFYLYGRIETNKLLNENNSNCNLILEKKGL